MRWSYKTVHYELKKDGLLGSTFLDESEIELSLNQYGKAGWELVSLLETLDGLIAIFKQPFDLESRSFSSPPRLSQRTAQQKTVREDPGKDRVVDLDLGADLDSKAEEVAEAILLDEFEDEGDLIRKTERKVDKTEKTRTPPTNVGEIRIE